MEEKFKYYSLKEILKYNALYNVIIGERSNGKSYATLLHGIKEYVNKGYQIGYIRRYDVEYTLKTCLNVFSGIINNKEIEKLTKNKYNNVKYNARQWYLCRINQKNEIEEIDNKPFMIGFCLSMETYEKSSSYPFIKNIIFEEFITRKGYLQEEFLSFTNLLSTIIRNEDNVKIFMLGNTINKYCDYFKEMGLNHILTMKQGTIDLYSYPTGLTVAVEYCENYNKNKKSNKYFAFDNPKLKMITSGQWEINIYPHLPIKYKNHNVIYKFLIKHEDYVMFCNLINVDNNLFIYIHEKTTEIKDNIIVYSFDINVKNNYKQNLLKDNSKVSNVIRKLIVNKKLFFQNNYIGECFYNYLKLCKF